jgi:hypothetical protein
MTVDVTIRVPTARAMQRAGAEFVQHRCPLCRQTFGWDAFRAHAPACIEAHPEEVG